MRSRPTSLARSSILLQRHDAGRVHDGRVEPRLHRLVQEHRVEHVAGRRLEPERHVGQPQDGVHPGQLGLDARMASRVAMPSPPALVHAGREGQGKGVEDEVLRLSP